MVLVSPAFSGILIVIDRLKNMHERSKIYLYSIIFLIAAVVSDSNYSRAGENEAHKINGNIKTPVINYAVMCEGVKNHEPVNKATVFSVVKKKVFCFTDFNVVPEKTHIYHRWYREDKPAAKVKLKLQPPRWSTFSSIQLRESDIGPWRVEVTDQNGYVFYILRFSITN